MYFLEKVEIQPYSSWGLVHRNFQGKLKRALFVFIKILTLQWFMKWITQPARSFFSEWFWSIKLIFEDYWLRSSEFSNKKGWSFCISFILIYQSGLHCLFYLKPAFIRFIICWNCFIFSSTAFLSLTSMVVLLRITREGINKHPLMMNWGLLWGKERKLNYLQISDTQ